MSLDPDNQRVLDLIEAAARPPIYAFPPQQAREVYRLSRGPFQLKLSEVSEVRVGAAPGPDGEIPLRCYRGQTNDGKLPVLMFYHGGGYVIGIKSRRVPFAESLPMRQVAQLSQLTTA